MFIGGNILPANGAIVESPIWIPAPSSGNWYDGAVAAYAAKGAASYAASKVNLANPGTFDCTDGTSTPTWNTSTGWSFSVASGSYLDTGVQPSGTWTMLIQAANITNKQTVAGISSGGYFRIYADFGNQCYFGNGSQTPFTPGFASGNAGFAGLTAYRDGASVGTISGGGYGGSGVTIFIGANNGGGGSPTENMTGDVIALGIWNTTLSAGDVASKSAGMAAI